MKVKLSLLMFSVVALGPSVVAGWLGNAGDAVAHPATNETFISCGKSIAKVVIYHLADQTDGHDELVHVDERILGFNEIKNEVIAPVIALEDVQSGEGTVCVRLAPLPHARSNPQAVDFT